MAKLDRVLVAEGNCHDIECAVRADMSAPAERFLGDLARGMWEPDPAAEQLPDDAQIGHYDKLLAWFEHMAELGLPPYRTAVNTLEDGIWEFKIGAARISYYDTDGVGGYRPKFKVENIAESAYPEQDLWWYPDFDVILRLGFVFPKEGVMAGPGNIRGCMQVREEDLKHDEE